MNKFDQYLRIRENYELLSKAEEPLNELAWGNHPVDTWEGQKIIELWRTVND